MSHFLIISLLFVNNINLSEKTKSNALSFGRHTFELINSIYNDHKIILKLISSVEFVGKTIILVSSHVWNETSENEFCADISRLFHHKYG